jgi:hypothetical protein
VARDSGWRFGQIVAAESRASWTALAEALDAPLVDRAAFDAATCPLVVAPRPLPDDAAWTSLTAAVAGQGAGLVFVLEHPADTTFGGGADIIGVLTDRGVRRPRMPNTAHAIADAQIPAARCAGRRLRPA